MSIYYPGAILDDRDLLERQALRATGVYSFQTPNWQLPNYIDSQVTCSYCKTNHRKTNCPNCGAPK